MKSKMVMLALISGFLAASASLAAKLASSSFVTSAALSVCTILDGSDYVCKAVSEHVLGNSAEQFNRIP